MTRTRTLALLALVLTLLVAACSQALKEVEAPTLEPQFGTSGYDRGKSVALSAAGQLYAISEQPTYKNNPEDEYYEFYEFTARVLLQRYDKSGNIVWTRQVREFDCYSYYFEYDGCPTVLATAVKTDTKGNAYVLVTEAGETECRVSPYGYNYLYKYDPAGNLKWERNVGPAYNTIDIAVDGSGNTYIAQHEHDAFAACEFEDDRSSDIVTKYDTNGRLQWLSTSRVGTPQDIAVTGSGIVYVVGNEGVSRYSSSGSPVWMKSGSAYHVTVAGSYLYTLGGGNLRKYSSSGGLKWTRAVTGINQPYVNEVVGDSYGNVYLTGRFTVPNSENVNAFMRKYSASGSALWTKDFGTPDYDQVYGMNTLNGSRSVA